MPSRYDVFYNGGIYHIYDKTIDCREIFIPKLADEFIDIFSYYRSELSSSLRYSLFKKLPEETHNSKLKKIFVNSHFMIEIFSFSLQPNHYHFLIKQLKENGIIKFMSNILNSITHYYNKGILRKGPIFLPQFISKRIKNQEQLTYTSRYIHTNCFAHQLVNNPEDIFEYPYSSIKPFISKSNPLKIRTDEIMSSFGYDQSKFKQFILNNAVDQKMREMVKYTFDWIR